MEEGFDPKSDSYYSEIDNRMKETFPHKFEQQVSPTQAVNSGNRMAAPGKAQRHCETHTLPSSYIKKIRCAAKRICEIREGVSI